MLIQMIDVGENGYFDEQTGPKAPTFDWKTALDRNELTEEHF